MSQEYKKVLTNLYHDYPTLYKRAERSEKDLKILASFYNLGKQSIKGFNQDILEEAMAIAKQHIEPKNLNDFYSILVYATKSVKKITKVAYPQLPLIATNDFDREFDIDKWAKLVYKIYDAVISRDMSLKNAIDYYASTLDRKSQEDFKFKKWIQYHLEGDGKKYAKKEEVMKKQSDFQFGLNGSNFYYPETIPIPERESFSVEEKLSNEIRDAERKKELQEWKKKLDGAIRRIDKLIRTIDDPTVTEELFNSLHNFNMTVQKAKNNITASDIVFRTANSFRKVGFDEGYNILVKTAQELENMPEENVETLEQAPPSNQQAQPETKDPIERVYEAPSGARKGEYEKLDQDISIEDAIAKLEEVAAKLSDRRVIRLLAEFDIMLDKIGIAAMFPELAESQSKLIESYSYAMVRVTKMLGMLSSGKSLNEISEARKDELTGNIRKEVNKTFTPKVEEETPRGEEAIANEFQQEQAPQAQQPE